MDFSVTRAIGGLVTPSKPTPMEVLDLSRIDRLPVLRCNARTLHVFGAYGAPGAAQLAIRDALSKALVPYYPLAGRLKDSDHHTAGQQDGHHDQLLLQIECSGEGVWFVEAFANCKLEDVGYLEDVASIPFDKLLPQHPHADHPDNFTHHESIINPLVLMQVTEFEGDGFVMGLTFCHSICDGLGAAQFLNAIGEFARGLPNLTVTPVWHRDFLPPPPPPPPPQYHQNLSSPPPLPMPGGLGLNNNYQLEQANIDIPLDSINQLKINLTSTTSSTTYCSAFEVIAASLWSHRTRAIFNNIENNELVKLVFFANCRELLNPPLPKGFYGNCFFPVTVTASSQTLISSPISDVVKLIQEAKSRLPNEFDNWSKYYYNNNNKDAAEGLGLGLGLGKDPFAPPLGYSTLFISEWGRLGFNQVDYGQGRPRHVVPMQGSSIIPVAIVGSLPHPKKGMRLMTWCVDKAHLKPFLHHMYSTVSTTLN